MTNVHEGMGMDKINNIKSAVASATLTQNSAKGSKPLAHRKKCVH